MPLETMVRRLRSHPTDENVAKVHWLERILEKEIDKESKSLEQLVTGFGRFGKEDRARDLRDWVSRVVRSGKKEYYKGTPDKEDLETSDGRMTELGVAVLNSVLKQFLEHAYLLGNRTDESLPNTIKVPGYLVLDGDVHPGDKAPEVKSLNSTMLNKAHSGSNPSHDRSPVMSPKGRQQAKCQNDVFHAKQEGKEIPLLPWKNLVKPRTETKDKQKSNHTMMLPKLSFRQKMNHAINPIRLMNDLKSAVSNRVESSMGGVMHRYRCGENPPRNRLGRQWERIRRSDISDKDSEGIKLELKELLNTITNRTGERENPEEWSDDVTTLPRVAFALPRNILMDSTTPGSQIKVSRYHCHKFVPSCAKYATSHRKHHVHGKNPTSELVNFLLMLHSNETQSAPKGATPEPDEEYGCYDDDEEYDDDDEEEEEDDEEDGGVDFGNPFQELKITSATRQSSASVTPSPGTQRITCTSSPTTSHSKSSIQRSNPTTCQTPAAKKTDPTFSPAKLSSQQCKSYYQSLMSTKDATEKKNFFGELRLVTKATPPTNMASRLEPNKNERITRSGMKANGNTMTLCSCTLGSVPDGTTVPAAAGVVTPCMPASTTAADATATTAASTATPSTVAASMGTPGTVTASMATASTVAANGAPSCTCAPSTVATSMGAALDAVTSATTAITTAPSATVSNESHTGSDTTQSISASSSKNMQQPFKIMTYPCATMTEETARRTLPPMPQHHEVLSNAPHPPPSSLPPCGATGSVKNGNMKKRASSRRNRAQSRGRKRHKIKHDLSEVPYNRRRYQRRKPKAHAKNDDQTGLLAILADPSIPGAMKNGLWRYVPYRMVHLQDIEKPLEIKRGIIRDIDRVQLHREPNVARPIRKKPLQRILHRGEPKLRRRYQETSRGNKDDNDYEYDDYESYVDDNYEYGP